LPSSSSYFVALQRSKEGDGNNCHRLLPLILLRCNVAGCWNNVTTQCNNEGDSSIAVVAFFFLLWSCAVATTEKTKTRRRPSSSSFL
jgi:hypothetical protein